MEHAKESDLTNNGNNLYTIIYQSTQFLIVVQYSEWGRQDHKMA